MNLHHYYIAVKNQFNADSTIYCGTNLSKMAKVYAKLVHRLGNWGYKFILDEDTNYDPDCGAFHSYKAIFNKEPEHCCELAFQNTLNEILKEFGKEAN